MRWRISAGRCTGRIPDKCVEDSGYAKPTKYQCNYRKSQGATYSHGSDCTPVTYLGEATVKHKAGSCEHWLTQPILTHFDHLKNGRFGANARDTFLRSVRTMEPIQSGPDAFA